MEVEMEKIPLWVKVLVTVGVVAIDMALIDMAFGMMNQPSTLSFYLGMVVLATIAIVSVFCLKTLFKKAPETKGHNGLLGLILLLAFSGPTLNGCTRVGPGHVGIKIDLAGDKRGVNELPLTTGWVWYNIFTQEVFNYPTFVQTTVWTKDPNEGSPNNEEITFNSKEGLGITGDISLSYRLIAEKVPSFYVKFRNDNLENFTHGYLRNVARDIFNEVAGRYSVEELYGPKKDVFLTEVRDHLNKALTDVGLVIEQFGFIGAPRPPQNVIDALNAKVAATQQAMKAENELRQATAEAQKKIAGARGEAESNKILTASITPALLQLRYLQALDHAIEKWNGQRPQVESGTGAGGLIIQLPAAPPKLPAPVVSPEEKKK